MDSFNTPVTGLGQLASKSMCWIKYRQQLTKSKARIGIPVNIVYILTLLNRNSAACISRPVVWCNYIKN